MPILHLHYGASAQDPKGQPVQVPLAAALIGRGPVVQVSITVAKSVAAQLMQQGQPVPGPVVGFGLIDTGASGTCIDDAVAQSLGLPVIDVVMMASASHASSQQNVYPCQFELVGANITIDAPRAMGAALVAQGLHLLIGRDVLQHCTLFYNGVTSEITLAI